ncbi:hypothetical protein ACFVU4_27865 [Streptomyces sp. NPDC058107]|uniref:hypothetical protein n=1 Tax=Streptomyces sp. NPDC058107 TaxID=3346343 RepID=UPI0036E48BD2
MSTALVRRPTENAAVFGRNAARPLPSPARVADLLIAARATDDRHGEQLFSCLLDRVLGLAGTP